MKLALGALGAVAILLCGVLRSSEGAQSQGRRPNILLILADDLGYADIGAYGGREIPTPHIDRLAAAGIRFTDAYVSAPYCSPSRAGLMTGMYPQRFGYEFNPDGSPEYGLQPAQVTMAERLRAAGYRTALFGKWHLGYSDRLRPLRRGFEEFYGFLGAEHSYVTVAGSDLGSGLPDPLVDGTKPVASVTYLTIRSVSARSTTSDGMRPSRSSSTWPSTPPIRRWRRRRRTPRAFQASRTSDAAQYAAMLSAMDDAIGRTLAALRDNELEEQTLVIFLNDNGGPTMPSTTENGSSNAPLRGSKRQTWEGGIRVAFVVAWKGRLAAGLVDHRPIIQLDVLPTALAAAGIPVKPGELDGVDLMPFLTGSAKASRTMRCTGAWAA
jgi:arylsulfatase A-like enzyme